MIIIIFLLHRYIQFSFSTQIRGVSARYASVHFSARSTY